MLASFANSNENQEEAVWLDIRTRLLLSLICSTLVLFLDRALPIATLSFITFLYVLQTRRFAIIAVSYAFIVVMTILSLGVVWSFFSGVEWILIQQESDKARMAGMFKKSILGQFYMPFLRIIPSINVLLALSLNFDVQRFMAAMKSCRLPRIIFLPLMVFCRFIPEFIQNVRQLREAVLLRGFSISFGAALIHPIQTLRLTLVPLMVRTLRIADNLAISAEMKRIGYAKQPTKRRQQKLHYRDYIALTFTILTVIALVLWQESLPELPKMGGRPQ